jgi:acylphosphatase
MSEASQSQRVQIRVFGDVHGVGFRYSLVEKAQELGLVGWTRNASDGSVEIVAEGAKEMLEKLISWTKEGPTFAKVSKIDVTWNAATGEFSGFEVKY